jgi:hypothetical protein
MPGSNMHGVKCFGKASKRENYSGGRRLMGSGTSQGLPITSVKNATEALKILRAFQIVLWQEINQLGKQTACR